MRRLFDGIPLDRVTTSMTINATAPILLALYLAVAEEQGVAWEQVGGTVQNDILKEYVARGTYIYPPGAVARWSPTSSPSAPSGCRSGTPISISGYHMREAGSTAAQEVAFTLANGLAYVEAALDRGPRDRRVRAAPLLLLQRPQQLPRGGGEVPRRAPAVGRAGARALRAARRALALAALPHPDRGLDPHRAAAENNVVRVAIQALAAVCGGTQSLHTNSLDEALGLPTEEAARLALRTQQVIAHESGVADVADPLGGSYVIEAWTDEIVGRGARLHRAGSTRWAARCAAIEQGFQQREIADAAYAHQTAVEDGRGQGGGRQRLHAEEETRRRRSCGSTRRSSASRSSACGRCGPGATPIARRRPLAALCARAAARGPQPRCRRSSTASAPR